MHVRKAIERLPLSVREKEVALFLAQGRSNQEIATILNISLNTVKFHVKNIYDKTAIDSRAAFIFKVNEIVLNDLKKVNRNQ